MLGVARYLAVAVLAAGAALAAPSAWADDSTLGAYSSDSNFYCAINIETGRTGCAASQSDLRAGLAADLQITPLISVLIARLYDNAKLRYHQRLS
jgi:predicted histidine transporter YuiF (NhaC family)